MNVTANNHLLSAHEKLKSKVEGKQKRGSIHKAQGIMGFLFRARASMQLDHEGNEIERNDGGDDQEDDGNESP